MGLRVPRPELADALREGRELEALRPCFPLALRDELPDLDDFFAIVSPFLDKNKKQTRCH